MFSSIKILFFSLTIFLACNSTLYSQEKLHAITLFGSPKYSPDFKHFDYVNPNATKSGELRRLALRTFDSFNPFIVRGNSAAGINLIYESLMTGSFDELDTSAAYGLIAESVEIAKDFSWVIYNIRNEAKWHDGRKITAGDVAFSMNILKEKGRPFYSAYYKNVSKIEIITENKIKFFFDTPNNRELPYIVGQMTVLPKHFFENNDFGKTTLKPPLGSGPYKINSFEPGRFVVYERTKNYWGEKLPINIGRHNFEKIRYDYYRDGTVAREAFKAHEFDIFFEFSSKGWATAYKFPAVKDGLVIKKEIPDLSPPGMQALVFNTRKEIFENRNVRKAIAYAFDFEWLNKNIFFNQYKRTQSFFQNMELASSGIPKDLELEYLKPHKSNLDKLIFSEPFKLPITSGTGNLRKQFREAKMLLEMSGWKIVNNKLYNKKINKILEFEILLRQPSLERVLLPFTKNLERLGINAKIRTIDTSQYIQRTNIYDYDMIVTTYGQSFSPGNEQRNYWGSSVANKPGSRNYAGIKNPVIDDLIEKIIYAPNRQHLVASTKALDRVLLWNYFIIPQFYSPNTRLAYWNKFGQPKIKPKFGVDVSSWWHDKSKSAHILESRSNLKKKK